MSQFNPDDAEKMNRCRLVGVVGLLRSFGAALKHPRPADWEEIVAHLLEDAEECAAALEAVEDKTGEMTTLVISRRAGDLHVQLKGQPGIWACGQTIDEALGSWMRTHSERTGCRIEFLF